MTAERDGETAGGGAEAAGGGEQQTQRPPEEIRADIAQTRAELGDTVEALAQKTDVTAQARGRVDEVKSQARDRVDEVKDNVRRRREQLTARAKATTPDSARQGGQQVVAKVRQNPAPIALGGALLAGYLLGRIGRR